MTSFGEECLRPTWTATFLSVLGREIYGGVARCRYIVPPMDDLWRFWGEDVKACGGDEEVSGHELAANQPTAKL